MQKIVTPNRAMFYTIVYLQMLKKIIIDCDPFKVKRETNKNHLPTVSDDSHSCKYKCKAKLIEFILYSRQI